MTDAIIPATIYSNLAGDDPVPTVMHWKAWCGALSLFEERDELDGTCMVWSDASGGLGRHNINGISAIVVDVRCSAGPRIVAPSISQFEYVMHSTSDHLYYKIIFPTARPLTTPEFLYCHYGLDAMTGGDALFMPTASHIDNKHIWPSRKIDGECFWFHNEGALVEPLYMPMGPKIEDVIRLGLRPAPWLARTSPQAVGLTDPGLPEIVLWVSLGDDDSKYKDYYRGEAESVGVSDDDKASDKNPAAGS